MLCYYSNRKLIQIHAKELHRTKAKAEWAESRGGGSILCTRSWRGCHGAQDAPARWLGSMHTQSLCVSIIQIFSSGERIHSSSRSPHPPLSSGDRARDCPHFTWSCGDKEFLKRSMDQPNSSYSLQHSIRILLLKTFEQVFLTDFHSHTDLEVKILSQ